MLGVAFAFGDVHPKNVDRDADFLNFKTGTLVSDGVAAIRANDEIGAKSAIAFRSFGTHTSDAIALEKKVDNFMLHVKCEGREPFGVTGEEIQEVPLRHERDKFATGWQPGKIGNLCEVTVKNSSQLPHRLMPQFQKFLEQSEFVHDLERRWMNGITAKIAVEVGMLF